MKETFVKEWHGIPLKSIKGGEKNKVPGAEFYANFYEKFFEGHQSWEDLGPDWVDHKIRLAKFIQSRLVGFKRVLSIGCGVGVIEKYLLEAGVNGLEIQEVSAEPLRWIRPLFAGEAVHVGEFSECLGSSGKYDCVFLSCVDCWFDEQEWIGLLREVKEMLNPEGRWLVVTPTYHLPDYSWSEICFGVKAGVKRLLAFFKIGDMGLMLGWRRSRKDFLGAMTQAGFESLTDGLLEGDVLTSQTFWVEGSMH